MGFSQLSLSQFLSSILFLFHFHTTISSSNYSSSSHFCAPDQSLSLLQFKESFSISSSASWRCQHPKTESWKEGTDCCSWDGVSCDLKTGQVTGLDLSCSMLYGTLHSNNSLFSLHHLQKLDLSDNDFQRSHISSQLGQFSNLTHLNLNFSGFAGQVPSESSHLSKLVTLDLSRNHYLSLEPISFDKLVRNLTQLRELDLSWVDMSLVVPNSLMNLSSSLSSLILYSCGLQGEFSSSMGKFKHLQQLDLAGNNLKGPIPYDFEQLTELVSLDLSGNENVYLSLEPISFDKLVRNLTQLRELYLSRVNMSLVVPNSLMNLSSSLSSLILYSCGLQGEFPSSMGKFKHLQLLDLADNNLTGPISYDFEQLTELVSLSLSGNENDYLSLEPISFDKLVRNLTQLRELDLSRVNMSLVVPNSLMNLSSSLSSLTLYSCRLQGKFPSSVRKFKHLQYLDLRNSNLTGSIPDDLGQLTELVSIDLSFNDYLSVEPSSFDKTIQNLTKLRGLRLGYVNMPLVIPNSLANLSSSLSALALWGCGLHGKFPDNIFLLPNLEVLDLTYNDDLTGSFPSSNVSNVLRLLGLTRTRISVYLGNDFFNNLKLLEVLVLRNSNITRSNLSLIGDLTHLTRLDLAGSNLSGQIPSSLTNLVQLQSLYLDNNNFSGRIPAFLGNCTTLQILDLSHNKIEDTFPYFLETLPELYILALKSNKLHGFVNSPTTKNSFSKLRVFDISNNNLSGPLPIGYFNSFEAMMASDQNPFYMMAYYIKVTWKGVEIEFEKIQSTLRILDLSNNSFTGEIPKEIGKLKAVQQLNLSHNSLTGHIQSSLGMFTNLESLDLSSNLLTGRIPVQLADLTFLAVLDLSHNRLEGAIPTGKQFNTFNASSFEGNSDLCGFPMPNECNNNEAPPSQPSNFHDGDDSKFFGEGFGWKAVAIGYGSGFVFGVTMGHVVFRTRKPAWFLKVVEDLWNLKARRTKKNARRNGARRN